MQHSQHHTNHRKSAAVADREYIGSYESPIGFIEIRATESEITDIRLLEKKESIQEELSPPIVLAIRQLEEYFAGKRDTFSVPLATKGTPFQRAVWDAIAAVPTGTLSTYKDIARVAGNPRAARAIGNACNTNPFLIVVPCHRIVHSDGRISGYACGADKKEWLLKHEKKGGM